MGGKRSDKLGAYFTLYHVLKKLITILAPIAPYITEEIYQNMVLGVEEDAPESVHMLDWEVDEEAIDQIWKIIWLFYGIL